MNVCKLSKILRDLGSSDRLVRNSAVCSLTNMGIAAKPAVPALKRLLNDEPLMRSMWERYRKTLLKQIKPDGSMPLEEARTHSLSYSAYNLDAFALVCRIAEVRGEHLWAPMAKPLAYLMPFVVNPVSWTKPQTQKFNPAGYVFPALAGLGLKDDKLIAEYRKMPISDAPWPSFVAMLVESSR